MTAEHIEPASPNSREYVYRLAGFSLASNIQLPELEPVGEAPIWRFSIEREVSRHGLACEWFHEWRRPSGELSLLMGRQGSAYCLQFPGLAMFHVSLEALQIKCVPYRGVVRKTLRHLLLDQVFPLILSEYQQIILHASAVLTPRGAIAFAASSGAGKSTLAAYLSLTGYPLLADDCLVLENGIDGLTGTPLYSGTRLWPDSFSSLFPGETMTTAVVHYSDKVRVHKSQRKMPFSSQTSSPIVGVYFLAAASVNISMPAITPISGREVFLHLTQCSFLLDATNPETLRNQFNCLRSVALQPVFRRMSFVRDYAALPEIRKAIEEDVQLLGRHAS